MTLREKQSIFSINVAKLIIHAYELGYEITIGEVLRTLDQQRLYFEGYTLLKVGSNLKLAKDRRKSKTMNSKHIQKCAIDINLFKDGKYLTEKEYFKPLAEYWKSLNDKNTCGYYWDWDLGHFQMS